MLAAYDVSRGSSKNPNSAQYVPSQPQIFLKEFFTILLYGEKNFFFNRRRILGTNIAR